MSYELKASRPIAWFIGVTCVSIVAFRANTAQAAFDDNLGYQWKSTAPGNYNVQLVLAKNTPAYSSTTPEILISETAQWTDLTPISISFTQATNPDPASPAPLPMFLLAMNVTNKTGMTWLGFNFTITDNDTNGDPNTTLADKTRDYPNPTKGTGGSLFHPNRAHFHLDSLQANQLGFTTVNTAQTYYNASGNLVTTNPGLDTDKGVYSMQMYGGFTVPAGGTWNPMSYVAATMPPGVPANTVDSTSSLLEIHDPIIGTTSSFTLTMQPIVPEPASGLLFCLGACGLFLRRRRATYN